MERDRLRVTHVIHELHPGGAEQVLVDLAAAFPQAGVDLQVLSLMPTEGQAYADGLRTLGVPLSTLDLPSRWDPRGLRSAVAAVAATRPDVVHTHMKHADLVGAFAARRLGVPMVSTLHLIEDAVSPLGRAKRWMAGQARRRVASRTIAVSDAVRGWYLSAFPRVAADSVVHDPERARRPGADSAGAAFGPTRRARAARRCGRGDQRRRDATRQGAGDRARGRGPAARAVPARDVRLLLVGDGELRPDLERHAAGLGLGPEHVVFAGHRSDVPALLQACDLLLHCSDFDALPTVLMEGLAAGLPIVAARVGGVPEIVTEATGRLVEPGHVDGLVGALAELTDDAGVRASMGVAARTRFAEEFEAGTFAARLRALYTEVRDESGRGSARTRAAGAAA